MVNEVFIGAGACAAGLNPALELAQQDVADHCHAARTVIEAGNCREIPPRHNAGGPRERAQYRERPRPQQAQSQLQPS